jgi:hypothetical protein
MLLKYILKNDCKKLNLKRNQIIFIESNCPLRTMYGSIESGAGYQHFTEYEIGAQRIGEAIHCILGSIGSVAKNSKENIVDKNWLSIEKGHIYEELDIIKNSMEEYKKHLYIGEDHFSSDNKNVIKSIESMKKASEYLLKNVKNLKRNIDKAHPKELIEVAEKCYIVLEKLAIAILESIRDFPDMFINAFNDTDLKLYISSLEDSIDKLFRKKL